jgi:hypothetical protein
MRSYAAMDPFAVIMFGSVGLLLVALLLLGRFYPGSGAEQVHWRPTRSPEVEADNEVDDLQQMLDAANARRRARGKAERTLADVERSVIVSQEEHHERRDRYLADQEIDEQLALKNERRARRGLPALTREDYESQLRRR